MVDPRVARLADVLVSYSIAVQQGEVVTIDATTLAAPLVRELYRRIVRAGGIPLARIAVEGLAEDRLVNGSEAQLDWVTPRLRGDVEGAAAAITIVSDFNTRSRSGIDPARQARATKATAPFRRRLFEREAAGDYRWVVTAFPTNALAQEAGMSLTDYAEFVFAAGLLDRDDPVAAWEELGGRIELLAGWLTAVRELRIVAPGTDLRLAVEGEPGLPRTAVATFPTASASRGRSKKASRVRSPSPTPPCLRVAQSKASGCASSAARSWRHTPSVAWAFSKRCSHSTRARDVRASSHSG